jgi:hypothetical protein
LRHYSWHKSQRYIEEETYKALASAGDRHKGRTQGQSLAPEKKGVSYRDADYAETLPP